MSTIARSIPQAAETATLLAVIAALATGATAWAAPAWGAQPMIAAGAAGSLAMAAGLVSWLAYQIYGDDGRFGLANAVTASRVAAGAGLAAAAMTMGVIDDVGRWALCAAAGLVLALDGVDGWVARRWGRMTAFGARYDMEADAALMLALGLLVFQLDQAGVWVLLIGAWRYAFLALGAAAPRFAQPLPPSLRRKTLCAAPLIAMTAAIAPIWPPGVGAAFCAAALAAVTLSFFIDIRSLAQGDAP